MSNTNPTKVIVPCRLSYAHLWEPDSINGSEPKYSVSCIIDKDNTDVIAKIKNDMISQGAYNAMMSGSGPTVFGIFPDEQTALKCKEYLKAQEDARQVYITETF